MSRLSLLVNGMLFSVLVLNSSLVAYAQGGAAARARSTVVASTAEEAVPITQKKYIGNVEAIDQVDSVARVSGTLTVAPGFEDGSTVKKGQLLAVIDSRSLESDINAQKAKTVSSTLTIDQTFFDVDYSIGFKNKVMH